MVVNVVPRIWKKTDLVVLLRWKFLNGNVDIPWHFYQSSLCLISDGARGFMSPQTETNSIKAEMLMESSQSRNARKESPGRREGHKCPVEEPLAREGSVDVTVIPAGFLLLNPWNWPRGQTRNPGAALSGPWCSGRGQEQKQLPLLFPQEGELVPRSEGGGESGGSGPRVAWVARLPLVGVAWRGMHSALLLRLASQKWQLLGIKDLDSRYPMFRNWKDSISSKS